MSHSITHLAFPAFSKSLWKNCDTNHPKIYRFTPALRLYFLSKQERFQCGL